MGSYEIPQWQFDAMLILRNNELDCITLASLMTSYFKNVELFSCMQIRLKIAIHSSLKYTLGHVKMSLWILRERERERERERCDFAKIK